MEDGTVYNLGMSISPRGPAFTIVSFPPNKNKNIKGQSVFSYLIIFTYLQISFFIGILLSIKIFYTILISGDSNEDKQFTMFDQATIEATLPSRWVLNPSYMHTFGITENFFIIVEQPLSVALVTMAKCRIKNEPMCTCLKWHDGESVSNLYLLL